jgi:hypothetical protein
MIQHPIVHIKTLRLNDLNGKINTNGDEMKLLSTNEVHSILMRKLNNIAIRMPRKESEKVLYIISQLENLKYFPEDIRTSEDYFDED